MKKYLIFLFLFTSIVLSGQGRFPYGTSTHLSSSSYPAVLDDGNTEGWYIAEDGNITKDGSNYVSQWDDVSGNNYHLTEATNQPTFTGDSVNFDGVNDKLANSSITVVQPVMIYVVFKQITYTNSEKIIYLQTFNTYLRQSNAVSGQLQLFAGSNFLNNNELSLDTWGIVTGIWDGASSSLKVNNGTPVTGDAGSTGISAIFNLAHAESHVRFKEVIVRSIHDSSGDQTDIINYLNDKYTVY